MERQYLELLSSSEIEDIHQTSIEILSEIGVCFPEKEALQIFQKHGFQIDQDTVYFTEDQVNKAINSVPDNFSILARNPVNSIEIGNGTPIFAPGYGAPFLIDLKDGKKIPSIKDYQDTVKLAQDLPNQDLSGHLMIEPQDVPHKLVHLYMLQANIIYSDKPFIGSTSGEMGSKHTLDLLRIIFGGELDQYYTLGLINPLSPLRYSTEMIRAAITYAKANQPLVFSALVMAGSTGPITLPGAIAQQNAELLAGIVLAQLIQPGLPIIFGTTSTNIDMITGGLALGSPELSLCIAVHAQLARKYRIPSRGGGALTDASTLDAQAGYESMFSLLTAINSGIDFVLHAAGIISSYLAFSFEKFVMDDELCGMLKHYHQGLDVSQETLALDVIKKISHDGHYLRERHTLDRCRTEFWLPALSDRSGMEAWWNGNRQDTAQRAKTRCQTLLREYQQPSLDSTIKKQIKDYITDQPG
jgi:trimethylamine--corrinoid protein Co-methyltransferase